MSNAILSAVIGQIKNVSYSRMKKLGEQDISCK